MAAQLDAFVSPNPCRPITDVNEAPGWLSGVAAGVCLASGLVISAVMQVCVRVRARKTKRIARKCVRARVCVCVCVRKRNARKPPMRGYLPNTYRFTERCAEPLPYLPSNCL